VRAIGARTWQERTPAMAAGLTDHPWTMEDLLRYRVLPAEAARRGGHTPRPLPRRPPHDHGLMGWYQCTHESQ